MKTKLYQKGIANIRLLVAQSIERQIPTLDYIMGFDKMSPTDKIWYEAYKKYGNRNHTWQDFRDMFYGDLNTMQKTVKNWKTWDEINNLLTQQDQLITEVKQLLKKYNLQSITKKDKDPERYEQFKKNYPDLIATFEKVLTVNREATQNYSTFSPEIAKLEKDFERKALAIPKDDKKATIDLITQYIQKMDEYINLKNADFVVGERIETYRKIILNNPDILHMTHNFTDLDGTSKVNLARMILNESAKIQGTPKGQIIHDDAPDGPHALTENQGGGYNKDTQHFLFKGNDIYFSNLLNFLMVLAHEDAHRIDYYNAEYGMIGYQIMKFVEDNYLNNEDIGKLYKKWATEQSSYYLDKVTATALKYTIEHQNE